MSEVTVYEGSRAALVSAADILTQARAVQEVMKSVMKEGVHYGNIPGTDKPTLLKPGAEKLCAVFRIADSYRVEDLSLPDCIRYRVVCIGTHQTTGIVMGEGVGECSSDEEKYRWVKAYDTEFNHTDENRRRIKYGWNKGERREYEIKQVRSNPADIANTILKMAAKRAKAAMVLNVTAASDIFSQDLEDLDERLRESIGAGEGSGESATTGVKKPQSKSKDKKAATDAAKTPASEGMIAHIRKRLEAATLTDAECFKRFGIDKFAGISVEQANEIIAWTHDPTTEETAAA